jgi:hypothetical protein
MPFTGFPVFLTLSNKDNACNSLYSKDLAPPSPHIPESVTSIGDEAFYDCVDLTPEVQADIERRFGKRPFE